MFTVLFLGLPVLGIIGFAALCERMARERVIAAPVISFLAIFAAYGTVLLFAVSAAFDAWSGMHSLAAAVLLFVAVPWLLIQGGALLSRGPRSRYHRAAAMLSLGFPVVLAALVGVAFLSEQYP